MSASIWPRRLALVTWVLALILIAIGGQVTTLGAGMAVKGWWLVEGSDGTTHFLPLFPGVEWTRDVHTFYEHTHRMVGMLVGLTAIATLVAARVARLGRGAVTMAAIALAAVIVQGMIGGFRVLEDAPQLAFLHGVTGQITFALIGLTVLFMGVPWQTSGAGRVPGAPLTLAKVTALVTLGQIALGAWYRHGLRNPGIDLPAGALHMHITGAFFVLGLVIALALRVTLCARQVAEHEPTVAARLMSGKKVLHALIGTQILLGFAAWGLYGDPEVVSVGESIATVLHLVVGALLISQCLVLVAWLGRARLNGATS